MCLPTIKEINIFTKLVVVNTAIFLPAVRHDYFVQYNTIANNQSKLSHSTKRNFAQFHYKLVIVAIRCNGN